MANILIVHQNFPAQFPYIAAALRARGDTVAAIGGKTARAIPGIDLRRWSTDRGTTPKLFPLAVRAEADLIRGAAAAQAALQLKRDGFTPDVIVGHPGWGETLLLKEIWPEARLILFGELMYLSHGGDLNFDPEFSGAPSFERDARGHAKNAGLALAYAWADRIVCPTRFQAASFPPALQSSIRVLHEGVDLDRAARRADARLTLPGGRILDASTRVVTYVSRTLEPLRGFHVFLRALPAFLDACPQAEVVVIGEETRQGYGLAPPPGKSWKSWLMEELGDRIDPARVHFLGRVSHDQLITAFSLSWAHVYYTYPFVLSWSLVEAMACECLVLASDTPPLHDAITDGVEGRLLPFFDTGALSAALIETVRQPEAFVALRSAARTRALAGFDRATGTAGWLAMIDELLGR
jgi:glycosyltransferase involved in cell wall biosynthesis